MIENEAFCLIHDPIEKTTKLTCALIWHKSVFLFLSMCMGVFPEDMSVHHMPAVPLESRRELLVAMWVLRSDPAPLQEQAVLLAPELAPALPCVVLLQRINYS